METLQLCSVLCILFHLSGVSLAQMCGLPRPISTVRVSIAPFRQTTPISSALPTCVRDGAGVQCFGETVLNDGNLLPDFDNVNDLDQFVVWSEDSTTPYMSVQVGILSVSTIDIYVLNYPAEGFGVPNFKLYTTSRAAVVDPDDAGSNTVEIIEFDLVNNAELSMDDRTFMKVTLRPRSPFSTAPNGGILLRWTFTNLLNVSWLGISEIVFCANDTDFQPGEIEFLRPAEPVVTRPSAQVLRSGSLTFICTVSSEGSFTWRWRKDGGNDLTRGGKFSILTADGTRTSVLTINDITFDDSAVYECIASFTFPGVLPATGPSYDVQFPAMLNVSSTMSGFTGEGSVMLTCEVSGYASFSGTPSWTGSGRDLTSDGSKYTINVSGGSSSLIFSNGSTGPSVVSTLTINQLSMEDDGVYTCSVAGMSSTTQLTIMQGTSPPTTPEVLATTVTDEPGPTGSGSASNSNIGVAVGVVVTLLILIIIIAVTIVIILVALHLRKKNSAPIMRRRKTSVNDSTEMQQRLTKADIEWQLATENGSGGGAAVNGTDSVAVYATVSKPKPPRLPSQNFIETGEGEAPVKDPDDEAPPDDPIPRETNTYVETVGSPKLTSTDGVIDPQLNIYEEARPLQRRMTNSSAPKLAKLKAAETGVTLDQNPIYESSGNLTTDSDRQALVQPDPPEVDVVYAQPMKRKTSAKNMAESTSEPVYSEALTPAMFKQQQVQDSSAPLRPFGPVYAQPTLNRRARAMENVKIVEPSNFQEHGVIGIGQFGEVVLAETINLSRSDLGLTPVDNDRSIQVKVAIKKLRDDADNPVRENFEKEIQFMSTLKDENIVMLLAVHRGPEPFIVMEYMENGDLHQFLDEYDQAVTDTTLLPGQIHVSLLVYMSMQVAKGMSYLASHNYVHRDLATRNCLVGKDFTVKIADFGMSKKLYGESYYKVKGRALLPIRWMATESFYGKFSEKTDVWSFGVVMWEIFTLCQRQPYEDLEDQEVIQDAIREGGRILLQRPESCPTSVYDVMLRCWEKSVQQRATFREVADSLIAIYNTM